jgi:hypothetical protein
MRTNWRVVSLLCVVAGIAYLVRTDIAVAQERMAARVRAAGLRMVGPNSMGGLSIHNRMSATFTTIAATLGLATASAALFATDAHRGLLVAALAVSLKQGLLGRTPPGSKALSLRLALLVGAALLLQLAVVLGR